MLKEFIIYSDLHIGAPNEIIENSDNYSTNSQNSLMDNSEKRILTNRIIHNNTNNADVIISCYNLNNVLSGVIVQKMINSEKSGTIFTVNPINNNRDGEH